MANDSAPVTQAGAFSCNTVDTIELQWFALPNPDASSRRYIDTGSYINPRSYVSAGCYIRTASDTSAVISVRTANPMRSPWASARTVATDFLYG
jgi:hypothetical protein